MYLFFDTETTGLPKNWKAPVTDLDNWPRLVQLGWQSYDDEGNHLESGDQIIRPEGFRIPIGSAKVHGISTERALAEGQPLSTVLEQFHRLIEESSFLVAHNMAFDEKIIGSEFLRNGFSNNLDSTPQICTMTSTVDFCQIEGPYGYKWPKLSELHVKLFGVDFEEAHNAAVDITATARCFWELRKRGEI